MKFAQPTYNEEINYLGTLITKGDRGFSCLVVERLEEEQEQAEAEWRFVRSSWGANFMKPRRLFRFDRMVDDGNKLCRNKAWDEDDDDEGEGEGEGEGKFRAVLCTGSMEKN